MTSICLIRHGETDWNKAGRIQGKTDIPLNEQGKLQAKKSAVYLEQSEWDILITSPLLRAKQTAEIINKKLHVPMKEMESFTERNFGDAEGMAFKELEIIFPNREFPNQEPRDSFIDRIMSGMKMIEETYPDKKVLLIAHGGVINTLLGLLSHGEIGSGKTKLNNACISNIYHHQDNWHIHDFNQIAHLSIED